MDPRETLRRLKPRVPERVKNMSRPSLPRPSVSRPHPIERMKKVSRPHPIERAKKAVGPKPLSALKPRVPERVKALPSGVKGAPERLKNSLPTPEVPQRLVPLWQRIRSSQALTIASATGLILAIAWIGWTIYVSAENGMNAGVGVLISWPAVLSALALVAAPFVGAWLLVRHFRPGEGAPAIAGAPGSEEPEITESVTDKTLPG